MSLRQNHYQSVAEILKSIRKKFPFEIEFYSFIQRDTDKLVYSKTNSNSNNKNQFENCVYGPNDTKTMIIHT